MKIFKIILVLFIIVFLIFLLERVFITKNIKNISFSNLEILKNSENYKKLNFLEANLENNEKIETEEFFYKNGKIKILNEYDFYDGIKKIKKTTEFSINGDIKKEIFYNIKNSKVIKIIYYFFNKKIERVEIFNDLGIKQKESIYYKNGNIQFEKKYKDNILEKVNFYSEKGKKKEEILYDRSEIVQKIGFRKNGNKEYSIKFKNQKKNIEEYFFENGKINWISEYDENENLVKRITYNLDGNIIDSFPKEKEKNSEILKKMYS